MDWYISRPYQRGSTVLYSTRLVISDVPEDVTREAVLDWLDDVDVRLDHAVTADKARANEQLTAQGAPRVRWNG